MSEKWNSLSSEEKLYHSVKTLCDLTLAGATPVGIVGGGQALPSVENIKTLCAAIAKSDLVTTTLVICSKPIADAFQKAGATATTVGQAVVDAVGVSFALVKEEKAVANETLAVIKNNPQIVAQEGGIVNAVKTVVSDITDKVIVKTKSGFELTGHAKKQLVERFGEKLSVDKLDELMNAKDAIRVIDKRTGNINVYVKSELSSSSLTRITVPVDGKRVVSIGFEPLNRIEKFISQGDFVSIK